MYGYTEYIFHNCLPLIPVVLYFLVLIFLLISKAVRNHTNTIMDHCLIRTRPQTSAVLHVEVTTCFLSSLLLALSTLNSFMGLLQRSLGFVKSLKAANVLIVYVWNSCFSNKKLVWGTIIVHRLNWLLPIKGIRKVTTGTFLKQIKYFLYYSWHWDLCFSSSIQWNTEDSIIVKHKL